MDVTKTRFGYFRFMTYNPLKRVKSTTKYGVPRFDLSRECLKYLILWYFYSERHWLLPLKSRASSFDGGTHKKHNQKSYEDFLLPPVYCLKTEWSGCHDASLSVLSQFVPYSSMPCRIKNDAVSSFFVTQTALLGPDRNSIAMRKPTSTIYSIFKCEK